MGSEFGGYLRELRLRSGIGLRKFAETVGMQASNLSSIEHGRVSPPQSAEALERIAEGLGLERGSEEWVRLQELAVAHKPEALAPDLEHFAARTPGVPVLLRTIEDSRLTEEDLRELARHIRQNYRRQGDGPESGS